MNSLPPWLSVQYPFNPLNWEGPFGRQSYVDTGAGPAVVFLHGNPTWSFLWREVILACAGERRCLAVDHLGCGLSAKPRAAPYNLRMHIENTVSWIRSTEIGEFQLVVHDWGGAIGFGVAMELADQIKGITILNTAAFPFSSIPARIAVCRLPVLGSILVRGFNAFVKGATVMTTSKPLPDSVKDGYLLPFNNWANRVAVARFVQDIPMRRSHPSYPLLDEIGNSLENWRDQRVDILWGMQDWCFHTGILEDWRRRLPGAHVRELDSVGHFVTEEKPDVVADSILQS